MYDTDYVFRSNDRQKIFAKSLQNLKTVFSQVFD